MWFTVDQQDKVGKITPQGVATTYQLPAGTSNPSSITADPNGNLWFAEGWAPTPGGIGTITTSGSISIFAAPTFNGCLSYPSYTVSGPGGYIWFADSGCSDVGYLDPKNPGTGWAFIGNVNGSTALITGPDNNLWVGDTGDQTTCIGKVTPAGVYTPFSCPSSNYKPRSMAATPDGYIWYGGGGTGIFEGFNIGSSTFTTADATHMSSVDGMTADSAGHLWLTGRDGGGNPELAWADASGNVSYVPLTGMLPTAMLDLAPGPNNTLWFITGADTIGKIDLGSY